jgi:hypothetical protein
MAIFQPTLYVYEYLLNGQEQSAKASNYKMLCKYVRQMNDLTTTRGIMRVVKRTPYVPSPLPPPRLEVRMDWDQVSEFIGLSEVRI